MTTELSSPVDALIAAPSNITKLLTALLSSANDLENVLISLLLNRSINTASLNLDISSEDAPLRVLGRIVNQPWVGEDSETYRRRVRARIATNRSSGAPSDLITIAALIVFASTATYVVTNEGTATVRLRVASTVGITDAIADILFAFESAAASAGVRLFVQWGDVPDSALFRYDVGPGYDVGHYADDLSSS